MSEEDPVPGYESTKKASEKQLRRLLTNEEPIDAIALQDEQQRRCGGGRAKSELDDDAFATNHRL